MVAHGRKAYPVVVPLKPLRQDILLPLMTVLLLSLGFLVGCGGGGGKQEEPDPLGVRSTSLPEGTPGSFYSATLYASGGAEGGYSWARVLGNLPPGITGFPATGSSVRLSGIPSAAGTYEFTVRLEDAGGASADIPLSIVISGSGGGGGGPGTGSPTSTIGAPVGRVYHTAVWTGSEMIIWGGFNRLGWLNTGAAYSPVADTWRTLSTVGAPTPRQSHTTVWTGTEMIVFGGTAGVGPLATGGAYNPTTDSWRPLPASGAPQGRSVHSAVWTGSRMIVWGGQGRFTPPAPNSVVLVFNDGFAYDPVSNMWSATALSPVYGQVHAAAWTGTRMVVWGGQDSFALSISTVDSGALYDPGTDTWIATDQTTAPAPRVSHTGVWSGTEFLVWGGTTNGIINLNSGGRLRPGSNSWQATNLFGAPLGRVAHSAVWTGTEMLVWGGYAVNQGVALDGGAYQPGTNAWRPLPAALDPTARYGHTAVWTGTTMIIWGGRPGNPPDVYLSSGAVIRP